MGQREDPVDTEMGPVDEEGTHAKREKVYKDDEELDDTIFIRNVARFDTTQESLKAHMEANWGETVYCLLCKDRETGESKGTAFVKFKDPEFAGACLGDFEDREMQQKFFLDGRNLFVLPALNRNQMGEVKKASARKEEAPTEEKIKKPRWYRTPVNNDPTAVDSSPVTRVHKKSDKSKAKRPDKHSNKNQMARGGPRDQRRGKPGHGQGGKGRPPKPGKGGKRESRSQPEKKQSGSKKKVKRPLKSRGKG